MAFSHYCINLKVTFWILIHITHFDTIHKSTNLRGTSELAQLSRLNLEGKAITVYGQQ